MHGVRCVLTPFFYESVYVRIDPGNALRFLVRVAKYVANLEYGMLPMSEQDYDWWVDISSGYNWINFMMKWLAR